jgi:hypothetical protein
MAQAVEPRKIAQLRPSPAILHNKGYVALLRRERCWVRSSKSGETNAALVSNCSPIQFPDNCLVHEFEFLTSSQ